MPLPHRLSRRRALLSVAAGLAPLAARTQAVFPERPITLVVPFAPGGIADLCARAVGQAMAGVLQQAVVVDNKPGAGAITAATAVLQAPHDGHTLLLLSNANAVSPALFKQLPFDVQRDFAPVSLIGRFDLGLFVAPDSRFASLRDLVAFGRANPGKLSIATIAPGSTQHLAAQLFKRQAGVFAVTVPYRGTPAVVQALRSGEVDLVFEILGPQLGQVQARALRVLAVSADQRLADLPNVPTVQQAGVAGYDVSSWNALAVPVRTPPAARQRLHAAAQQALRDDAVVQRLRALGVRPQGSTPEQLATLLASETRRWGAVVRDARIELE
ncbi:hypothetical protein BurJ1DRAFT_2567 [Burkholderiales bacterium JOSHI_001]|nr:hypothetical protein BurJ1DRAFT_2567 [Burkholderiales bacterium JOSHI_001]